MSPMSPAASSWTAPWSLLSAGCLGPAAFLNHFFPWPQMRPISIVHDLQSHFAVATWVDWDRIEGGRWNPNGKWINYNFKVGLPWRDYFLFCMWHSAKNKNGKRKDKKTSKTHHFSISLQCLTTGMSGKCLQFTDERRSRDEHCCPQQSALFKPLKSEK